MYTIHATDTRVMYNRDNVFFFIYEAKQEGRDYNQQFRQSSENEQPVIS